MGGTIYDLAGWQGVTAYHTICQGTLLLMFCLQPALKNSFMEVFFGVKEDPEDSKTAEESGQKAFSQVVPEAAPPASLLSVVEEIETLEMEDDLKGTKRESEDLEEIPAQHRMSARSANRMSAWSETHRRSTSSAKRMSARSANRMSARSANRMSARSETHRMSTSSAQVSNATSAVTTGTHRTARTPTTVITSEAWQGVSSKHWLRSLIKKADWVFTGLTEIAHCSWVCIVFVWLIGMQKLFLWHGSCAF